MSSIATKSILKILGIFSIASLSMWMMWTMVTSSVSSFKASVSTGVVSGTQAQVNNMRKEIRSADKYIQKFKTKAIDIAMIPDLLNKFETKVPSATVHVSGIAQDNTTNILKVSLTFECNLTECMSIAKQEAKSDLLVGVEDIIMTQLEGGSWSTTMNIKIPLLPKNI